jgi:hypothetical protein
MKLEGHRPAAGQAGAVPDPGDHGRTGQQGRQIAVLGHRDGPDDQPVRYPLAFAQAVGPAAAN